MCHGHSTVFPQGVALRDIKLENTLLAIKEPGMLPSIKLCDFGYSKVR